MDTDNCITQHGAQDKQGAGRGVVTREMRLQTGDLTCLGPGGFPGKEKVLEGLKEAHLGARGDRRRWQENQAGRVGLTKVWCLSKSNGHP